MGSEELAANWFRITQTEAKIACQGITDNEKTNDAHHDMGVAVRGFILAQGGTPPVQLPTPSESIAQLCAREQKRLAAAEQAGCQPSLFDDAGDE